MILTRISPYGFQVDNKDDWHNYDKNMSTEKRFHKGSLGKKIDFRKDKNGRVVQIFILKQSKPKLRESLLVKVIECGDPVTFEGDLNSFGEHNKVIATQTHITESKYIGVVFYEPSL